MWIRLASRFELVVFDLRGHGVNRELEGGETLDVQLQDLHSVLDFIRRTMPSAPLFGLCHSLSGIVALRTALDPLPGFDGLILFEPPLAPPPGSQFNSLFEITKRNAVASTLRRRRRFDSTEDLVSRLAMLPPTASLSLDTLGSLASSLLFSNDGQQELLCRPEVEAGLYEDNNDLGIWDLCSQLQIPVVVQSGGRAEDPGNYSAQIAPTVAQSIGADLISAGPASHFAWLDKPSFWSEVCADYFQKWSDGRGPICRAAG